jgi:hypothetical protein
MKNLSILLALLASSSALAGEKYVCNEYDPTTEQLLQTTVVLTQKGDEPIVEGKSVKFSLELFRGSSTEAEVSVAGKARTNDVKFVFTSDNRKVSFSMYLDEANQSSLSLSSRSSDSTIFVCR